MKASAPDAGRDDIFLVRKLQSFGNRMMNELRQDGLIATGRRTLKVLDFERLKKIALFDGTYLHMQGGGQAMPGDQRA